MFMFPKGCLIRYALFRQADSIKHVQEQKERGTGRGAYTAGRGLAASDGVLGTSVSTLGLNLIDITAPYTDIDH